MVVGGGEDSGGLLDDLRGAGVGTEDPNIVGDVGPTDIPPGPEDDDAPGPLSPTADQEA